MNIRKLDKKQIETILAVVLIVVFLGILLKPRPKKMSFAYQKATENVGIVVGVLSDIAAIQKDKLDVSAKDTITIADVKRDPFDILVETTRVVPQPLPPEPEEPVQEAEPEVAVPKLTVQGLLYQEKAPASSIAIMNGIEYKVGDTIEGWTIEEIRSDAVVLRHGKQRHEVKLY